MGKQNMAMFEQAMRMFNPFQPGQGGPGAGRAGGDQRTGTRQRRRAGAGQRSAIDDLKRKLDELQNQLAELSKKS